MRNSILYLTIFGLAVPFFLYAQPGAPATPVPPAPPSAQHHILIPLGATSYLGVGVAEIDNDRARALNLKEAYGVEITHVDQDSPAEKAGLKAGDVVLEYNGQRVEGIEEFQRLVRETPAGRTVRLLIGRGGSTQTLLASIGNRRSTLPVFGPGGFHLPDVQMPDMPQVFTAWRTAMLGVEAESLGPQLAEYFGVKEGVLVRSVLKGSPAEKAGIKAGDIITKVDQTKVATPGEVSGAVRAARTKKTFPLELMRDHRDISVMVTLDEDRSDGGPVPAQLVRGTPL